MIRRCEKNEKDYDLAADSQEMIDLFQQLIPQ